MTRYRNNLPQLDGGLFLTDGGIETTLIFHQGYELPHFAAFDLLRRAGGEAALTSYFQTYADLAKRFQAGLILESATWRASADWGALLGYNKETLAEANRKAIKLLEIIRDETESKHTKVVISGCLGPRGDGYTPGKLMSAEEAEAYHQEQINTYSLSGADMVSAITMNYVDEALGIARAAKRAGMPVAISFTVETDGKLATGQTLESAIRQVDEATAAYPAYFMVNCAHPTHFEHVLMEGAEWTARIRGLRANASCKSHAELNDSSELDIGDLADLSARHAELVRRMPNLNILGGCCGTDHRHVEQIAKACQSIVTKRL